MSESKELIGGGKIPQLGLGVYQIALDETARLVERALEVGYRHFDTARIYGNEEETGAGIVNFLKKQSAVKRQDVFYTTKIYCDEFGHDETVAAVEDSLQKVKELGYLDLILIHSPEASPESRLQAYGALQECKDRGLVREIGVSNYDVHHLKELFGWSGFKYTPVVNQIEVNPWLQQQEVVDFCHQHKIVVETYSPLMLGKYFKHPELLKLGAKYHRHPAQILIKWNLQKGYVPLPKSGNVDRLVQNFDVWNFALSDDELQALGDPSSRVLASAGHDPMNVP